MRRAVKIVYTYIKQATSHEDVWGEWRQSNSVGIINATLALNRAIQDEVAVINLFCSYFLFFLPFRPSLYPLCTFMSSVLMWLLSLLHTTQIFITPGGIFFFISSVLVLFFYFPYVVLFILICPCLFLCTVQHTQHKHLCPHGILFFVFACTLLVLNPYLSLCLDCPAFCLLYLLTTHNTNIHAPGRTRTPQSQQSA